MVIISMIIVTVLFIPFTYHLWFKDREEPEEPGKVPPKKVDD